MVTALAHPSLALIKYWGKANKEKNLPATTSIALTLEGVETRTTVDLASHDEITIGGQLQDPRSFTPFLNQFRQLAGYTEGFSIKSENSFPTAAGLASSSSGYAALAGALNSLLDLGLDLSDLSRLARIGSGSACRAVYEGFTIWEEGSQQAELLAPRSHWDQIRVLLVQTSAQQKKVSSRWGMGLSRDTSPYYPSWLESSRTLIEPAKRAVMERDLPTLGPLIQQSYLRMFATMFTSEPPFIFWLPDTVALIHWAEELREEGISIWETMDAGPQVKFFFQEEDRLRIARSFEEKFPHLNHFWARPGRGVQIL